MKNLSIKSRVTAWYTIVTVIIAIYLLLLVIVMCYNTMCNIVKNNLVDCVNDNLHSIWFDEEEIRLDDIEVLDDDVVITVYDYAGNVLKGNLAKEISKEMPGKYSQPKKIKIDSQHYYAYDAVYNNDGHYVVVRGITSLYIIVSTIRWAFISVMCVLPVFILMCVLIGYNIAKSAFAPVEKISSAVSAISNGEDLSKRIGVIGVHDEIGELASTFDNMFDRLEGSFEREKQFTSNASHELRTPVSVIMSQCEYALNKTDSKEEMRDSLSVILEQSKKISNIISQLLMIARNEKDKLELEIFDFGELGEIVLEEMEGIASEKGIKLYNKIESGIFINADRTRMTRALINLISNAIKYGKIGGYVKLTIRLEGDNAICVVEDNGIGISEENIDKIWNKFYQVDNARAVDREYSIGLGLYMVKNIIELHKGKITVKSEKNKGSSFSFIIPIVKSN